MSQCLPVITPTRDNSTNMNPIDKAVEEMKLQEPGENLSYKKVAKKHDVSRVTLARRCKGTQASRAAEGINRRVLSPQQEMELVQYIKMLTERSLPPKREIIRNSASCVVKEHVGEGWVTRFVNQMHNHLTSQ
jgi:transposase-like protein